MEWIVTLVVLVAIVWGVIYLDQPSLPRRSR